MAISEEIVQRLESNDGNLTELNLREKLAPGDLDKLLQALQRNTCLKRLDLSYNKIGDIGAKDLAANKILYTLNLGGNRIGDPGAKDLAANTTLRVLDMSNNSIGDLGTTALAANDMLKSLRISGSGISLESINEFLFNATLTDLEFFPLPEIDEQMLNKVKKWIEANGNSQIIKNNFNWSLTGLFKTPSAKPGQSSQEIYPPDVNIICRN